MRRRAALAREVHRDAPPADDPSWWDAERVGRFLDSIASVQARRLDLMRSSAARRGHGASKDLARPSRWEIRADGIAGCLRTARGGSSKQSAGRDRRARCPSSMRVGRVEREPHGRSADLTLPGRRKPGAFRFGDAVCVPVIQGLASRTSSPSLRGLPPGCSKQPERDPPRNQRPSIPRFLSRVLGGDRYWRPGRWHHGGRWKGDWRFEVGRVRVYDTTRAEIYVGQTNE